MPLIFVNSFYTQEGLQKIGLKSFGDNVLRKNVKVLFASTGRSVMTQHNKVSKEKHRPEMYLPRQIDPVLNRLCQRTDRFERWVCNDAAIAFELDRTVNTVDGLPPRSEIPPAKLVFIAGCSQSGKTTLASSLKKTLGGNVHIVHQDGFCTNNGGSKAKSKKRERDEPVHWEGAQFTNWPRMCKEIEYRCTRNLPNSVVIVEGYTLFHANPELNACRERADAILVLEIDKDACAKRRKSFPSKIGYGEIGWDSAAAYARGAVWPHYEQFEKPKIDAAGGHVIRIDGMMNADAVLKAATAALEEAF